MHVYIESTASPENQLTFVLYCAIMRVSRAGGSTLMSASAGALTRINPRRKSISTTMSSLILTVTTCERGLRVSAIALLARLRKAAQVSVSFRGLFAPTLRSARVDHAFEMRRDGHLAVAERLRVLVRSPFHLALHFVEFRFDAHSFLLF